MRLSYLPMLPLGLLVTVVAPAWPSEPRAETTAKKAAESVGSRVVFRSSMEGAPEPLRESPDGRIIVKDGRLFDKIAGQPLGVPLGSVDRNSRVRCWAFSPDGKLLAIGSEKHLSYSCGGIRVIDLATGATVAGRGSGGKANFERVEIGPVMKVAFSQDSQTLYYSAGRVELSGK